MLNVNGLLCSVVPFAENGVLLGDVHEGVGTSGRRSRMKPRRQSILNAIRRTLLLTLAADAKDDGDREAAERYGDLELRAGRGARRSTP